jgi:hypothetical protein
MRRRAGSAGRCRNCGNGNMLLFIAMLKELHEHGTAGAIKEIKFDPIRGK